GDGDAPRVDVGVGDHPDAAPAQDLIRLRRRRAVGGLDHDLRLDPGRVLRRNLPLQSGRDEDVALELECVLPPAPVGRPGEVEDALRLPPYPPPQGGGGWGFPPGARGRPPAGPGWSPRGSRGCSAAPAGASSPSP